MYPKRITPCPLVETIVEIRYSSLAPREAVFGLIYQSLPKKYSKFEPQPILQLPEAVRSQDENLKYQPHYVFFYDNNLQLRIGPQALVFACITEYVGWENYSAFIMENINKINESRVINTIERIGLRYVNLFKESILHNTNIKLSVISDPIEDETLNMRIEKEEEGIIKILQLSNKVVIQSPSFNGLGSMVDIDCILPLNLPYNEYNVSFESDINRLHKKEKEYFYEILKPDFIKTLNPEY